MDFVAPQLATLVEHVPTGDAWIHEQKFDGYRIVAVRERSVVRLYTRRGNDWTESFPTIAEALAELATPSFVIDGEVAVVMPDGVTSFHALQRAIGTRAPNLVYFVFDLLALGRDDLRARPLLERKAKLARVLAGAPSIIRSSDHVIGHGEELFAAACKRGLEGLVSKRADAPYTSGRGTAWVKTKCRHRQELVVGGFTEPSGSRTGIGALLCGYYDHGVLRYAGKVGTGFSGADLADLYGQLHPLERKTASFQPAPPRASTGPRPHWVEPRVVVEVAFGEWTPDGRLRHPSFQGIRADKPAREIVREA